MRGRDPYVNCTRENPGLTVLRRSLNSKGEDEEFSTRREKSYYLGHLDLMMKFFLSFRQGYLKQARKRTDMFSEEQIAKIFSNIEQIYLFHQEILRQLEECFVEDDPYASEIGGVFLNNVSFIRS